MKTSTKTIILFASIIFIFCLTTYAEQAEQPKQQLQFVTANETETINIPWDKYPGISKPAYIVIINFKNARPFPLSQLKLSLSYTGITLRSNPVPQVLVKYVPRDESKYDKSLEFIELILEPTFRGGYPQSSHNYAFFANSEQEAKKIIEAFINICNDDASLRLDTVKTDLAETQKTIAQLEKSISANQTELEPLNKTIEEKIKAYAKANYTSENEYSIYSLTEKHIHELANLLRNINFDLAGLDAKIDSINKYKKSDLVIDNETLIKLNQILISTDIERAGALAKKQAYETALKQANDLYDLISRKRIITTDLTDLNKQLSSERRKIPGMEQILENLPPNLRPVEVEDNTVIIRSVEQD